MAKNYGYQYETSPRKIEPEYRRPKPKRPVSKKTNSPKKKMSKTKAKKKARMSFEVKFFINSMLFFAIIFAMIACQAMVNQRYKEKESLKQQYSELLASSGATNDLNEDTRKLATEYGMQTKSATLIDLGVTDYIESSENQVQVKESFWEKILNFIKGIF